VNSDYLFDNFLQFSDFRLTPCPRNPSPFSAELPWLERCERDDGASSLCQIPRKELCQIIRKVTESASGFNPLLPVIMQSIFRTASRREMLGEHSGGRRRDGGLKMGWTKLSGCGEAYGYRLPARSWRRI
jgi:hypothetical protein